ncbi:MAG: CopG family transcriptional regulator [Rhodobacteraceae bacterium]|nr:CopG family transcriptional regulator [Paracoccaceae bacterium]
MPKQKNTEKVPKTSKTDKDDKKKNTSLRLNSKTLKALKMRAIEDDTSVQKIIEDLVETYLKTPGKAGNAPD